MGKGKTKFVFGYDRWSNVEVTVKKLRKPAIVYKIAPSRNSKLAGRKIVGVASVGDKNAFAGICTLSEYFPSSSLFFRFCAVR